MIKSIFFTVPYYFVDSNHGEYLPPMHLVYISSFLKEKGYESEIIDISADFGIQRNKDEIIEFKIKFGDWVLSNLSGYDVIGISCYTSFQYLATIDMANIIRQYFPTITIVVGGYHASALPNDFIFKGSPIDYCVIGEGENAMLKILEAKEMHIPVHSIVSEKPVYDVNKLIEVDFELIKDWSKYYYYYDYLSRGCPFHCRFCMESVKIERRWRSLTVDHALNKIHNSVNHVLNSKVKNQNMIMLNDPNFGMDKDWLKALLKRIIDLQYPISFFVSPRIDNLDFEILELMKEARFAIDIPVESGSKYILKLMNKSSSSKEYLDKASKLMKFANQIKLPFHTHWIFGYPGETIGTLRESFKYMQDNHSNNSYGMTEIFFFKLYPGSWIYNNWYKAEKLGAKWLIPEYWKKEIDIDENEYNIHPSSSLNNEELISIVNSRIKAFGQEINKVAINNHNVCCSTLKQENAPWII